MNAFEYKRAQSASNAIELLAISAATVREQPRFLAGGTNIIDLWREGVMQPPRLVDVGRLNLADIQADESGAISLGAMATNAQTANHPLVAERLPLLRSAILAGASPQIRNRATNGGNLLQRTRCLYFYDTGVPCNKREPGTGCPAATGLARQHAIFGASPTCVAVHPSDMCVALAALDAEVHVQGPFGERVIPFEAFHRLPEDRPDLDSTLQSGELITRLVIPEKYFQKHSTYLKIRERMSYAFALVSVAAALELDESGRVVEARVALGGVAHKPWRNLEAESMLLGELPTTLAFRGCAARILSDAKACGGDEVPGAPPGNSFKIPLAERAIVRALEMATQGIPTNTGEDGFRALGAGAAGDSQ